MLLPLPILNAGFALLTVVTVYFFYRFTGSRRRVLVGLAAWVVFTGAVAATGFFHDSQAVPPRLALVMLPMLVAGLLLGFTSMGRSLRVGSSLEGLHYFQGIRILVEIIFLHGLYEAGYLARAVTYLGYNFDIIPGVLGLVIGHLVYGRKRLGQEWSVAYQYFGILVLTSTIVLAVLSAPSPYQQLGQAQPTVAIFYLPFVWLPAVVAPLMLWAHFIALGILYEGKGNSPAVPPARSSDRG